MKRADFIINIALVPIDFAVLIVAALSAYFLRFSEMIIQVRPVFFELPFEEYLSLILKVSFLGIIVFAFSGFYAMQHKRLVKELPRIITAVTTLVVFLVLGIFLTRELFSSRFIIILAWVFAIVYLFLTRVIIILVRNYFFKKGRGLASVIVVGDEKSRQTVVEAYKKKTALGFRVIGEVENLSELERNEYLSKLVNNRKIDSIIQTDSSITKPDALDLLTYCQENHITLSYVASLFQAQSVNQDLNSLAGFPIIEIKGTPLDGWRKVTKRLFDFVVSLLLLIVLSWVFIIFAILIKLDSKGSVFVALPRVGSKGKTFKTLKFRSMVEGAHKMKSEMMDLNERTDGPLFKIKNDPRVTRFGRFLRKTSLDELPQLFNVLVGQMSLVGPRPHEPEEVSRYQKGYKKLLGVKPGITGMAQVSGRSDLPFSEEAKLDIFYIENWSIFLDMIIILKTIKVVVMQEQAY